MFAELARASLDGGAVESELPEEIDGTVGEPDARSSNSAVGWPEVFLAFIAVILALVRVELHPSEWIEARLELANALLVLYVALRVIGSRDNL